MNILPEELYGSPVKVEMAKELLKNINRKIYEISEEMGYLNVQYFQLFLKCYRADAVGI